MHKKLLKLLVIVFLLSRYLTLYAAGTAEQDLGGQLLKQIEQERQIVKPLTKPPTAQPEEKDKSQDQGPKIKIKHFVFEGNQLITSLELEKYLSAYLGRELSLDELKLAVNTIANFYQEKGYLAQATLPKQDVTEGDVRITIIEAKFGGVRIETEDKANLHVKEDVIQKFIEANNPKGKAFNLSQIDRGLILLNDLPGISVEANLQAGQNEGETESILKVKNRNWLSGNATIDNQGSHSTGGQRFVGTLNIASPLRFGDKGDLTYLHSEGSDYIRLAYNMPIGYHGLRVGLNSSALEYNVVPERDTSGKHARGHSSTYQAEMSYPIYRSKQMNLNMASSLEHKYFLNKTDAGTDSENDDDILSAGLSGNMLNNWLVGGQTNASLDLDIGKLDRNNVGTSLSGDQGSHGARTNGRWNRIRWNMNHTQFILNDLSAVIKANGQFSDSNLDSSEKLYLGGASGVRAYPASEGSGSMGYILNVELRKELPRNFTATGFYDFAYATQYVNNSDSSGSTVTTGATRNAFNLKGYGLSVDWRGPYNSAVSAIWAKRIGTNPNPATNGSDSDGSHKDNFLWLKASLSF
jgi:hemolysin activation/secretion protein